ncbi:hypothetical protein CEXT_285161 [Caerostris extrusa]|uniref:Secreted protein n=1 Tax=Caerostris extrusa TaxID=172846 RepID=A0AAV4V874_CAEEX|nr:hypothetical protein CEXT_285161 [Caerostris extrusa]
MQIVIVLLPLPTQALCTPSKWFALRPPLSVLSSSAPTTQLPPFCVAQAPKTSTPPRLGCDWAADLLSTQQAAGVKKVQTGPRRMLRAHRTSKSKKDPLRLEANSPVAVFSEWFLCTL